MPITVVCSACGGRLSAPNQLIGRMAKCPQCGQTVKVAPSGEPPAEAPRPTSSRKPRSSPSEADAKAAEIVVRRSDDSETPPSTTRISYGLGIPSLILGIVAFAFSWVPQVGLLSLPLSGLGLLLGIAGLVVAIIQHGRGIVFPIAGSALSLGALVVAVFWLGLLGGMIRPNPAKDTVAATGVGQAPEQTTIAPAKAAPEKEARWADASADAVQQNDVRVQLGAVVVRNIRIKDVLGDETVSPAKHLTIQVFIDNMNSTRKIDFLGWSGATVNAVGLADLLGGGRAKGNTAEPLTASERNAASLTDNFGNPYKRFTPEVGAQIPGQINGPTSVYPGKRTEDLLVFEPPVDKVQFLRLELPAGAFGGSGNLRLQIPKAMIHR
ncbi:MAG TPA: hypothetical protein VKU02_15865 [Gemmataceae bacterium]|nr:hypothetical protein [Gemmataceae bacterium]